MPPICPVCKQEAYTIEMRRLDRVPDKPTPEKNFERTYREMPMCSKCYKGYLDGTRIL